MTDSKTTSPQISSKLRAALEYLGEHLCTHRASRFKPRANFVLDEWRARRRGPVLPTVLAGPVNLATVRRRRPEGVRVAEA